MFSNMKFRCRFALRNKQLKLKTMNTLSLINYIASNKFTNYVINDNDDMTQLQAIEHLSNYSYDQMWGYNTELVKDTILIYAK
jgi:hypothetical protein